MDGTQLQSPLVADNRGPTDLISVSSHRQSWWLEEGPYFPCYRSSFFLLIA